MMLCNFLWTESINHYSILYRYISSVQFEIISPLENIYTYYSFIIYF